MSSIKIRKISITDFTADAVVNAANSGLMMGGGVCGYIFRTFCVLDDSILETGQKILG